MRDANSFNLYKNKDCNNYRVIYLLSIVGKVFAQALLINLQKLAERVYPESQCGFRAERSAVDMVFCLRQLQEKNREHQMPLYVAFIDLTKAFDLLCSLGCPPRPQSMIKSYNTNMMSTVQFNSSFSRPFIIRSGVKQGCVLAPTLFGIFFCLLLKCAFDPTTEGVTSTG